MNEFFARNFGQWMVGKLTSCVEKLHLHMRFSAEPAFTIYCPLSQKERLFQTYQDISAKFGDVLYIVHVFAEKNSPEFTWVRNELSTRYALIGKLVRLDKSRIVYMRYSARSAVAKCPATIRSIR